MIKKFYSLFLCLILLTASVGIVRSETIKLVWDANQESDLAGYKVYQSNNDGGPYTLIKDVANVTELEIDVSSADDGTIYYVATAYDTRNNESNYSNQASYTVDHTPPAAPSGCTIRINW